MFIDNILQDNYKLFFSKTTKIYTVFKFAFDLYL